MQQWEIKKHWVPTENEADPGTFGEFSVMTYLPKWKDEYKKAWAEAELLANDGWEIVSVTPIQAGHAVGYIPSPNDSLYPDHGRLGQSYGHGTSYTLGLLLVFKRPKP